MKTRDARSLPAIAQEDLRRKAIKAIGKGQRQLEVARLLGVTRQAVGNWVKAYREKGLKALRAQPRGRPPGRALRPWQAAQIVRTLLCRLPDQLGLPFYLWTRAAVGLLIKTRYGRCLSRWTVGRYLARWNFTPQRPQRRAFEQDPQAVGRWLKQRYPAIRQRARREKATIFWGDEMGLRSSQVGGRSYGRRGQTPVVPATGKRFGCNLLSAINNQGRLYFMVFKQTFDEDVFLIFLERLLRQVQGKIFLIVDAHPAHCSDKVHGWVKARSDRIRLFFLPAYSPQLNPDEMLNQDVKQNAVAQKRPRNQRELMAGVHGYLRRRQRQPHIVRQYFQQKNVRYAAT